jgi:hypothetical protein
MMEAIAEPGDGCEAYFHFREELGNVKRIGWIREIFGGCV